MNYNRSRGGPKGGRLSMLGTRGSAQIRAIAAHVQKTEMNFSEVKIRYTLRWKFPPSVRTATTLSLAYLFERAYLFPRYLYSWR